MSSTKIICDQCGTTNAADASTCKACGWALTDHHAPQANHIPMAPLFAGILLRERYRILEIIGQGGMGTVYKAEDLRLGQRIVAIKEMSLPGTNTSEELESASQAFAREAHLLARLSYPFLPGIYDHFEESGRWYLIMQYINGTTLSERLKMVPDGGLFPDEALSIGIKLCTVLGYLHAQTPPIIFGDLKPSNVMLTPENDLYLIDFGIARLFQATQGDERKFISPGYSPPEQYQSAHLTPRSDIYSLGATLHHMFSGYHPSKDNYYFPSLQQGQQIWTADLNALVKRMVEQNEQQRPQDVTKVKQELQRIAALYAKEQGITPATDAQSWGNWTSTWGVQNPRNYSSKNDPWGRSVQFTPPSSVTYRDVCLTSGMPGTLAWSPDGSRLATLESALTLVVTGDKQALALQITVRIYVLPSEKNLLPEADEVLIEVQSWSLNWGTHKVLDHDDTIAVSSPKSIIDDYITKEPPTLKADIPVSWSPDGIHLACAPGFGNVTTFYILDTTTNDNTNISPVSLEKVRDIRWSPDGKFIAIAENSVVHVWDVKVAEKSYSYQSHTALVTAIAWSPDSTLLASADTNYSIYIWHALTGNGVCQYNGHSGSVYNIIWSLNNEYIVSCAYEYTLHIWDAHTAQPLRLLEGHTTAISGIAFFADERLLVSTSISKSVILWRTDTWAQVESFNTPFAPVVFHPSMPLMAVLQGDNKLRIWEFDTSMLLGGPSRMSGVQYTNAKVVLVGDSGVGKSGIGLVLAHQAFRLTESTHGRVVWTFARSETPLDDGRKEMREILLWDLAGQPGYRLVHQLHLSEVAVALVVFDAHSETDPFAGISHWVRALRTAWRVRNKTSILKMLLVHARIDRGGKRVSQGRIEELVQNLGFDGYFETSAKEGTNIPQLAQAIHQAIDWEHLPKVTSTELFQRIKSFLLAEKQAQRLLSTAEDLYRTFQQTWLSHNEQRDVSAEFATCVRLVESAGFIRRLSFGDLVLLQPEKLDSYASALVNAVRDEPDGLGNILEEYVRNGDFFIPSDERIEDREQEKLLLIAMVEDLLSYDIALREQSEEGPYLVLPSESTRENPALPHPENVSVVFTFEGPVLNIYATMAVRLSHSGLFKRKDLWKNAVTYETRVGGTCGILLRTLEDGQGELTLFFDKQASEETRFHFEEYVHVHLQRKALPESIQRRRIFRCEGCGLSASEQLVRLRLERDLNWYRCPGCETTVHLLDREERLTHAVPSRVPEMDRAADVQRVLATAQSTVQGKQETNDFDVFLSYNHADRDPIIRIGERLKKEGLLPWLDEWDLPPGRPWQALLEEQIEHIKSAAVFVGADGVGPWQQVEMRAFLNQFVQRGCPVIPVLLENAPSAPQLPLFLKEMTWVDFRRSEPEPFRQLTWGITGKPVFLEPQRG